ncbi:hypothetical protein [Dryocola sp. BD626]|uniref:hypothetical protein n=1 Tax=Dryocola sp. BD626 TaxID=3133273 RepID=UPI003F50CA55
MKAVLAALAAIFGLGSALAWHLSTSAPTPELANTENHWAAVLCVIAAICVFACLFSRK